MTPKEYIGDIIGGSLMVAESRVIAETLLKHLPEDDWKYLIIDKNVLQKNSPHSAIRFARTIKARIGPLGDDFLNSLIDADEGTCIQLLMMALLIHSPIEVDFMRDVLIEARRTYQESISPDAWQEFIDTRIRAMPKLGKYSESSIKKIGNNAIKILVDSGYLNTSRQKRIQRVYLLPDVKRWLSNLGRDDLIDVMECTV